MLPNKKKREEVRKKETKKTRKRPEVHLPHGNSGKRAPIKSERPNGQKRRAEETQAVTTLAHTRPVQ